MLVPVKAQLNSTATEMVILNVRQSTKSLNPKRTMLKKIPDSEPTFFIYTSQLQTEKRYLLEEALPD